MKLKRALQYIILLGSVVYITIFFWKSRGDIELIFVLDPLYLVSIIVIFCFYLILHGYRYQIIIEKCSGIKISSLEWFKLFILGRFLNKFIPQSGNAYRSYYLKESYNIPYTRYLSSLFSFAWMDTIFNLVVALFVIMIAKPNLALFGFKIKYSLIIFIGSICVLPILLDIILRYIKIKIRYLSWVHSKISEVLSVTLKNISDGKYILKIFSLGGIIFFLMVFFYYLVFLSFDVHIELPELVLFYALYKLNTHFNITPGNLGIRELFYGFLSEQLGIGMAQGIMVSALLRIINYSLLFVLGISFGGTTLLRQQMKPPPKG